MTLDTSPPDSTPTEPGSALHRPPRGWARYSPLAGWAALGAAVAYVLTVDPTRPGPFGPCPWTEMLGIDGPGCGGTRMVYYLLHGNLVEAARHHLVALVGFLYALYALVAWSAGWLFGKRLPLWRPSTRAVVIYVVVFLVYAVVLRNLPWEPFTWFYVEDPVLGR